MITGTSPITVQDILDQLNDYLSNYTTGAIDLGNRLRAINRAMEYVQRRMTIPSDKTIQQILFSDDNPFYGLNTDFNEPLQVYYSNKWLNKPGRDWRYRPDDDILQTLGQHATDKYFGWTTMNGTKQLVLKAKNIIQGSTLITFDQLTTGIVGQGDAIDLAIDNNVYVEGNGSLAFEINPVLGTGRGSIYIPVNWNIFQAHNALAYYKFSAYLPTIELASINLVLGSSPTDYYVFTTTTQDGGDAWAVNSWNTLSYAFSEPPTIVGSPNDTLINFARLDFVEGSGFGVSTVSGFRVDDFYNKFPDLLNLVYLSNYKAYADDGATLKFLITEATDIPLFGYSIPDLLNPVALRAAYLLMPQMAGDKDFMAGYKEDCEDVIAIWAKTYPRRRTVNFGRTILQRSRQ